MVVGAYEYAGVRMNTQVTDLVTKSRLSQFRFLFFLVGVRYCVGLISKKNVNLFLSTN